jgi:hypothetical protein
MSLFSRLFDSIGETASTAFSGVVEAVRTVFAGDPETRRKVAFSVAVIALSAKMAKADGIVAPEEVRAFQEIFAIPQAEAEQCGAALQSRQAGCRRLRGLCTAGGGHVRLGRGQLRHARGCARRLVPHRQGGRGDSPQGARIHRRCGRYLPLSTKPISSASWRVMFIPTGSIPMRCSACPNPRRSKR